LPSASELRIIVLPLVEHPIDFLLAISQVPFERFANITHDATALSLRRRLHARKSERSGGTTVVFKQGSNYALRGRRRRPEEKMQLTDQRMAAGSILTVLESPKWKSRIKEKNTN